MKRPRIYYDALSFAKGLNTISDSDVAKIKINSDYEYYTRYGIYRGNHYQIIFTRQDSIITVSFVYKNFKRPHCDFCISYNLLFSDILNDFDDFRVFCLSSVSSFFYTKNFKTDSNFLR